MEARLVEEIPTGDGWQYEPKWDGFRCLAFRDDDRIFLQSKNGQPLARYFPDVVDNVAKLPLQQFVLDGELVIPVGGALSFDELQLRLHPAASRVQKLAAAKPAVYIVFDLLAEKGKSYLKLNLRDRRYFLEKFARSNLRRTKNIRLSPATTDYKIASDWLRKTGRDLDGIIAKRLDAPYASGERTAAVKVKQIRTADCVVGGFRYATGARVIGSLLLGLYDDEGLLHHVGFISGFKASERRELTEKFEATEKTTRIHRQRARRTEPLEHGAHRRMGTGYSENCRGSCLRSFYRRPVSTRHKIPSLATGQRPSPVHDGSGRASRRQRRWHFCKLSTILARAGTLELLVPLRVDREAPCFGVAVETRDARSVQVSFHDYRMNVALSANRRCVAKKFRDRANRRFDIRFRLFLCLELFLFTKRDCGQYRATPGTEMFCGKIFTCDLA